MKIKNNYWLVYKIGKRIFEEDDEDNRGYFCEYKVHFKSFKTEEKFNEFCNYLADYNDDIDFAEVIVTHETYTQLRSLINENFYLKQNGK